MTTKYQHIIPAWYIAWFSKEKATPLRDSLIFYYDIRANKIIHNKASNILWEEWYFEVDYKYFLINKSAVDEIDLTNIVEKEIQWIENLFLEIIDKIEEGWSNISMEDKNIVIHYALHVHMRTKRKRQELWDIWKKELEKKYWKDFNDQDAIRAHKDSLSSQGLDPSGLDKCLTIEWVEKMSQLISSRWVLGHLKEDVFYEAEFERFSKFTYQFVRLSNEDEFISSDHPIIPWLRCIIFPIDKKTCLIGSIEKIKLTVDYINRAIASTADSIIIASNNELIMKYIEFLSRKDWTILMYLDKEIEDKDFQKIFELTISDFI